MYSQILTVNILVFEKNKNKKLNKSYKLIALASNARTNNGISYDLVSWTISGLLSTKRTNALTQDIVKLRSRENCG